MQKQFLIIALFTILMVSVSHAQTTHEKERIERTEMEGALKTFKDNDKDFKVTAIPDKWKNESAVIIAQKFTYLYEAEGISNRVINYVETTRRRIKILDKAAVENFSTFYFYSPGTGGATYTRNEKDQFGIQIIKPDGSVKTITKQDAIKVDVDETPSIFRARLSTDLVYYKAALPDVSIGDIIDYFLIVNGTTYNYSGTEQDLPPVITTLITDYPIQKQRIEFIVDRGFYINIKSSNGAPELKKNENIDRNTYSFTLMDEDRPRVEDTRWMYNYRQLPTIKFQVVWARLREDSKFFLGEIDQPKTSVTADEIAEKVSNAILAPATGYSIINRFYVDAIESGLKRDHREEKSKKEIARLAYYYFRHIGFASSTPSSYSVDEIGYMPSFIFAPVMYKVLEDYEIPCEIFVAPDRSISQIGDVVLSSELNYCIRVNGQYMYSFSRNSNYDDIDPDLIGQDGYTVEVGRRENMRKAIPGTLPVTSAADNTFLNELHVTFDDVLENIRVESKMTVKGLLKSSYRQALYHNDWEKTDYLAYEGSKPEERPQSGNKNKLAEEERLKNAKKEEERKELLDLMKDFVKDDFTSVVSYDDFSLISDGRTSNNKQLVYTEKFSVGDLVKKAGPNYAVSVGALIGGQVEIEENEKKRDYDVWLPYPRTLTYQLIIELPAGYKAEGLEALNSNVDNLTGSFISTAKLDGQKLLINVAKTYKTDFVKKEDWLKMVEFLDAAYNFTQKKIVIRKGG